MIRKIKIIDEEDRQFNGIIKLCPKISEHYNCYFILTNCYSFNGQAAKEKEKEGYKYSWCLEKEQRAKEHNLDLKKLKNFNDYDWSYRLPISHNYHIIFMDNSGFEEIIL